jgi:geranylgeranyl reductase family protein
MLKLRVPLQYDSDIVIVGAGPAGAATAAHLARNGLNVILVDRQRFPRDKVCGDFVGPIALLELQCLDITEMAAYRRSNVIHSAAVFLNGKQLITSLVPDLPGLPAHGRVVPRIILDRWIVDAACTAGAHLLEGYRAQRFQIDDTGVTLLVEGVDGTRMLRARALVGADGSSSLIARLLRGQSVPDEDRIIAVRAYYKGVEGLTDQADLYFTDESFPGYCWLFPTSPTTANVGVGMILETLPHTNNHLRELLLWLIEQDAGLNARLRNARLDGKIVGWPLTTYNPRLPIIDERVLLVGDAAGLINSLNGEGIQYALLSGRWAAETLADCATQDDFSRLALQTYATRVQRELRYDMALSGMIVQLIRNRSLNPLWLQALQTIITRARVDPSYADVTGGVLAGLVPASSVLNTTIIGNTLKQAVIMSGIGAVKHLVRGPAYLAQLGLDTTQFGFDAVVTAARHPGEFLKWGVGVAASAAELAGQASRHTITSLLSAESPSSLAKADVRLILKTSGQESRGV